MANAMLVQRFLKHKKIRFALFAFGALFLLSAFTARTVHKQRNIKLFFSTKPIIVFQGSYLCHLESTPKGKDLAQLRTRMLLKNQVLNLGLVKWRFNGKITPDTPGASIPSTLRSLFVHKSLSGQVISTFSFDLKVQSDGRILPQTFRDNNFDQIEAKEPLFGSILAVDKAFPAGVISIKVTQTVGGIFAPESAWANLEEPDDVDVPATTLAGPVGIKKAVFFSNVFAPDTKKGSPITKFDLKLSTSSGFQMHGVYTFKGKFTENEPGTKFPGIICVEIHHKAVSGGKLLATDEYELKVDSAGKVAAQKFPFATNSAGIPESLEFVILPMDRDFPNSRFSVKFVFLATPV